MNFKWCNCDFFSGTDIIKYQKKKSFWANNSVQETWPSVFSVVNSMTKVTDLGPAKSLCFVHRQDTFKSDL